MYCKKGDQIVSAPCDWYWFQVIGCFQRVCANCLNIKLTRNELEERTQVIKAEIVTSNQSNAIQVSTTTSSACVLQWRLTERLRTSHSLTNSRYIFIHIDFDMKKVDQLEQSSYNHSLKIISKFVSPRAFLFLSLLKGDFNCNTLLY